MSIPPISGSNPYQGSGPSDDPSAIITKLRYEWMGNPTRETAQKLLDYIKNHHSELREVAEEQAEWLDEEGLPFPELSFEKAYKQAVTALQAWMDKGCDPNNIASTRTSLVPLIAWVSDGVCE